MSRGATFTGEDLGKLIPYVVSIVYWLKDNSPRHAADTLADPPSKETQLHVNNCISQLLSSIDASEFELSNAQLRYILSQYNVDTWAHTVKLIVCDSANPSLIDESIKKDLVDWAYYFIREKEESDGWNELFEETGSSMSKLGHISFLALGEFCSMIRDCSNKVGADVVSGKLGWEVLGDNKKRPDAERKTSSGILFQQLVNEAARIFGQSGAEMGVVSFGIRSKVEITQWSLVHFLPPEKKAMQDLRTFYSYIDKKFVGIVEDLFQYHEFVDIAEAINNKYGMIPAPWKTTLSKMKQERKAPLQWFDYTKIKTPAPGAKRPTKAKNSTPLVPVRSTALDVHVDSFIDSEVIYYRRMGALGNFYVKKLQNIASKRGSVEAKALMLSDQDIDTLFGYRFQKVLELTHQILTNLEVINLTRRHVKSETSREQILADVILQIAPEELFTAYSAYSSTYPHCAELLKQRIKKKQFLQQKAVRSLGMDFLDHWHQLRKSIKTLEDKELEEVMELPVDRIHKYRTILKQILQNCDPETKKYTEIYKAYAAVRRAADRLTEISAKNAHQISPGPPLPGGH